MIELDGTLTQIGHFADGEIHRVGGPATTCSFEDGSVTEQRWVRRGMTSRLDGPADTSWAEDGSVRSERWFVRDERFPGAAEVAVYAAALDDGAPHEWAHAFALGSTTGELGWRTAA